MVKRKGAPAGGRVDVRPREELSDGDVKGATIAMRESFEWYRDIITIVVDVLDTNYCGKRTEDEDEEQEEWKLTLSMEADEEERLLLLCATIQLTKNDKKLATYVFNDNQMSVGVTEGCTPRWIECEGAFLENGIDMRDDEEMKLLKSKCEGYCAFKTAVEEWVANFNAEWQSEEPKLRSTYEWNNELTNGTNYEDDDDDAPSTPPPTGGGADMFRFGDHVVKVLYRDEVLYEFCISYFDHTVEDVGFFYRDYGEEPISTKTRTLVRELIGSHFGSVDGHSRTLLGMLSTWNRDFCTLCLDTITWVPKCAPRAVLVSDGWVSTTSGGVTSDSLGEVLKSKDALQLAKFGARMERHGLRVEDGIRKFKELGYYGLISSGKELSGIADPAIGNILATRGVEIACAVNDVCV